MPNSQQSQQILRDATHQTNTKSMTSQLQIIPIVFEEQVSSSPDRLALVSREKKFTYAELSRLVHRMAYHLKTSQEIKPGTLIPVCMHQRDETIVAILAILMAGAAYVPIDPSFPDARIRYILGDTVAPFIITDRKNQERLATLIKGLPCQTILYETLSSTSADNSHTPLSIVKTSIEPSDLAYVIYTSGSTGKPKGVMVAHAGVVHLAKHCAPVFGIEENPNDPASIEQILCYSNFVFDAHVWEVFTCLLNGHTLHVIDAEMRLDRQSLHEYIRSQGVTIALLPPALLDNQTPFQLKTLILGGEQATREQLAVYANLPVRLMNAYGLTETTVITHVNPHLEMENPSKIGLPIPQVNAYVLDEEMKQVSQEEIGELCLSGICMARGYLNDRELTDRVFVKNPFQSCGDPLHQNAHAVLFKTGDLVRVLSDGMFEYCGRIDSRIKLRGYRIELGEVEAAMNSYSQIVKSVVVLKESADGDQAYRRLVGYYVPDHLGVNREDFLEYLASRLPDYMVPKCLVELPNLPMNLSGKIDKSHLPDPSKLRKESFAEPNNPLERQIRQLWSKVLCVDESEISINENFFALGGNSILAIRFAFELAKKLERPIPPMIIFQNKTIATIASALNQIKDILVVQPSSGLKSQEQQLSYAQERLYFIERYCGGTAAYNVPLLFEVSDSAFDSKAFQRSLEAIIQRHEILRTRISSDESGNFYQIVSEEIDLAKIFTQHSVDSREALDRLFEEEIAKIFDLHQDYPLRVCLCRLSEGLYYLLFVIHHIAFDGWSADVLMHELDQYYRHYSRSAAITLPEMRIQYKDFAVWQRNLCNDPRMQEQDQFWKNYLHGFGILALIPDKTRPKEFTQRGETLSFLIDQDLSLGLREMAKTLKVSLQAVLLSSFYLMLRSYTCQNDLVVGTPVLNRHYSGVENLIGFFVNTLPIRTLICPEDSIVDFIQRVAQQLIDLQSHQDIPFEKIVSLLNLPRDLSTHPIFQVMFGVQSFGGVCSCDWLSPYQPQRELSHSAKFDLSLFIDDSQSVLKGEFNFASDIFEAATILRFIDTYRIILKQFLAAGTITHGLKVKDLSYLHGDEERKMIELGLGKVKDYPFEKTLPMIFEDQVKQTPHAIALVDEGREWSYDALNRAANRLAHYLKEKWKVGVGDLVVLWMDGSASFILSLIAILKTGAAYVPIDASYPKQRTEYILKDTQAKVILVDLPDRGHGISLGNASTVVSLDAIEKEVETYSENNISFSFDPNILAYVIYTSGTTGVPKGVMIEHRSVVNYLFNLADRQMITKQDRVDFSTKIGFDLTVTTTLTALCLGACICIYGGDKLEISSYVEYLKKNAITVIKHVPSYFELLIDRLPSTTVRCIILGGEKLKSEDVQKLFQSYPNPDSVPLIYDEYGPTEATVGTTICRVESLSPLTIGSPYNNINVYVLNENLTLLPFGAVGELFIGGIGLSRGYLNDPLMTKKKFIDNPLISSIPSGHSNKIYKSGDRVRWHANGCLEYLGRLDSQVKIHGYRIEVGEIEHHLNQYSGIKKSIVRVISHCPQGADQKYLTAYYVTEDGAEKEANKIKTYLAEVLPDHMIPQFFVHLQAFPLTSHGKIDEQSFPKPVIYSTDKTYQVRNEIEGIIQHVWAELFNIPQEAVPIDRNFFELGGNSILILKMFSKLEKSLKGNRLTIVDLFRFPTIESLAKRIAGSNLKMKSHAFPKRFEQEIAVIGMSGAFSGSKTIDHYWHQLLAGKETIRKLSKDDCKALNMSWEKVDDPHFLPVGGMVDGIDQFDPEFWGLALNDGKLMDPQIRKFLEYAYHALECAGYIRERHSLSVGVFAGMSQSQYHRLHHDNPLFAQLSDWEKRGLADQHSIATQVSYYLGLTGVSLALNTACSTSLVAVIEACKNLSLGVCDLALAGGVALTIPEDFGDVAQEGMIFSLDGNCSPFDQGANGTIRGSGIGVVVLKPLEHALRDQDHIFSVIKGYAVNNDGRRKVGYTAPSPVGQAECLLSAYRQAEISPHTISYIECHGTGTTLGDAIEIEALREVFSNHPQDQKGSCFLGSVKANIGHADTAAGIAAFLKACKMVETKIIPPQIHVQTPHRLLQGEAVEFCLANHQKEWIGDGINPFRIGVSSFGIGGTNAHIILEAFESSEASENDTSERLCIIPLSAKNEESLKSYRYALHQSMSSFADLSLESLASALQHCRDHFPVRAAFVCGSKEELRQALLVDSPNFQSASSSMFCERRYHLQQLADSWCSGCDVTWEPPANAAAMKKASSRLPGYRFQTARCWFDKPFGQMQQQTVKQNESILFISNAADRCPVEEGILRAFIEVLGCDPVDKQKSFFELGGNSLSALRLAKKMSQLFGVKVSAATIFKNDSVAKLTMYWTDAAKKPSPTKSVIMKGEL